MIDLGFLSTAYLDFRVFKIAKSANTCLHIDSSKVGFFFYKNNDFIFILGKIPCYCENLYLNVIFWNFYNDNF